MRNFIVYYAWYDHVHDCPELSEMSCPAFTIEDAREDFKLSIGENYNNYPILHIKDAGEIERNIDEEKRSKILMQ